MPALPALHARLTTSQLSPASAATEVSVAVDASRAGGQLQLPVCGPFRHGALAGGGERRTPAVVHLARAQGANPATPTASEIMGRSRAVAATLPSMICVAGPFARQARRDARCAGGRARVQRVASAGDHETPRGTLQCRGWRRRRNSASTRDAAATLFRLACGRDLGASRRGWRVSAVAAAGSRLSATLGRTPPYATRAGCHPRRWGGPAAFPFALLAVPALTAA